MNPLLKLQNECVGLYELLCRTFSATDVVEIASDYARCASAGANAEEGIEREQGVSFRPRIARIITILVKEAGLRDVATVRSAVIACAVDRGFEIECEDRATEEVVASAASALEGTPLSSAGFAIAMALELDTIRHLHMTSLSTRHKEHRLSHAALLASIPVLGECTDAALLRTKLAHAISLQRRSLQGSLGGDLK